MRLQDVVYEINDCFALDFDRRRKEKSAGWESGLSLKSENTDRGKEIEKANRRVQTAQFEK